MRSTTRQKLAVLGALVFAAVLAVMLTCFVSKPPQQSTFAPVYATEQVNVSSGAASAVDSSLPANEGQSTLNEASTSAEGETIDDEENPMSSGLGGAEPVSSSMISFGIVAICGIIAVAAFFMALMRKLNGNINDMNKMFK